MRVCALARFGACVRIHVYVCVCACMCICVFARPGVYIYVCVCNMRVYVCVMCVCVRVCVCTLAVVAVSVDAHVFIVIGRSCSEGCGFDSHCRPASFLSFNSRPIMYGAVDSLVSTGVLGHSTWVKFQLKPLDLIV